MNKWKRICRSYRTFTIVLHITYWILVWWFMNLLFGYGELLDPLSLLYSSIVLLVTAGVSYWIIYFLIPRYLLKGRYVLFLIYIVFTIVVSLDLELLATFLFLTFLEKFQVMDIYYSTRDLYSLLSGTYFIVFLSVAIKLVQFWYQEQKRKQTAINDKVETELKLLKSQIHPHFLFNTLNNIYALSLKKSDQASDAVLKLSELLNYLIYEGENESVSLKRETEHIQNYIALEKLRYGSRLNIEFFVSGNPEEIRIAPLLLLPLVENAFKHGVSKSRNQVRLTIKLEIKERNVDFYVLNSIPAKSEKEKNIIGTGLKNLRQRLLLIYEGKHSLEIREEKNQFEVHLKINT